MLLFSATMPDRIRIIANKHMKNPKTLTVKTSTLTVELTEQIYFEVNESDKFESLCRILDLEEDFFGMVFCRTKIQTDDLAHKLADRGYGSEALHGDLTQGQREQVLKKFKNKRINVLCATDVAARGIDVDGLTHVINYSLPQDPEAYVPSHRPYRPGGQRRNGRHLYHPRRVPQAGFHRTGFQNPHPQGTGSGDRRNHYSEEEPAVGQNHRGHRV